MDEVIVTKELETDPGFTIPISSEIPAPPAVPVIRTSTVVSGGSSSAGAATAPSLEEQPVPLLSPEEAKDFRARWDAIQVNFVDDPRRVVEQVNGLVEVATKRLAEMFAVERAKLEGQWERGENVLTEDLRLALRRYRSFFGRLLSV